MSKAAEIPLAVRVILVLIRKDPAGYAAVLREADGEMEALIEDLSEKHASALGATGLVSKLVAKLDQNKGMVLEAGAAKTHFDDSFETYVFDALNKNHFTGGVGVASETFYTEFGDGKMTVKAKIVGEEVEQDTNHPGDTDERVIDACFEKVLGATRVSVRWDMDYLTSGFRPGHFVIYDVDAEWVFKTGQGLVFTVGNKVLVALASKVIAAKTD